jgi:dCTP deaminase
VILSDSQICRLARGGMITPFSERLVGKAEGVLSYGLSTAGYDIRLGMQFKEPKSRDIVLDPKRILEDDYRHFTCAGPLVMEPGRCILGRSVEVFSMPRNVLGLATNKSTYARLFLDASRVTVAEPGWSGVLTIELSNQGPNSVVVYPGEGILQMLFFKVVDDCDVSYDERNGKYMHQEGVVLSRI